MQHPLGRRHLPQHIHVNDAFAIRALVGDARLLNAAGDGVGHQLLVALAPGAAEIKLRDWLAGLVVAVGVDAGERADPARGGPGARTLAVRDRNALAAFDKRQHLAARNHDRIERLHRIAPCRAKAGPWPLLTWRSISGASEKTEVTPQSKSRFARAGSLTVKAVS